MTVCSSLAELLVNKKQPAEIRFMKSSAPQNLTLTSPGSTSTLFGENLQPARQEKDSSEQPLSSQSQLAQNQSSDLNMQYRKLRCSVEVLTHQIQNTSARWEV